MRRLLQKLFNTLVFACVYGLTVFFVPTTFYVQWAAAGAILVVLWLIVLIRFTPSRKEHERIRSLAAQHLEMVEQKNDVRVAALAKEMTCPACTIADNLWSFLVEGSCPKCGSSLWTVHVPELDSSYSKLQKKKDAIDAFYAELPAATVRKIKTTSLSLDR